MHVFSFPTLIHFGPGVRQQMRSFIEQAGLRRPLVVTDKGLAALPVFEDLVAGLRGGALEPAVFSGISGNPAKTQAQAGGDAYRAHRADSIVGVGGGAALDVAKAIAVLAHHRRDLFEYEDGRKDALPIDGDVPPWIAVPTTAGTGSEVGRSAVISDDETHVKKIIFSPRLLAKAVFADPELTLKLPPAVTAATGMDALTHCIEAYLAKDYHPICDGIALEGLRLAARSLARCVEEPSDVKARGDMLMASMMGAIAFQKGLGITHSFAHALSAVSDLHHGLANGVMIERALAFNLDVSADRFKVMAQTIGLEPPTGEAFLAWLTQLKQRIGIPANLTAAGVSPDDLERLSQLAFADSCHQNNPRPCAEADFRRIWAEAF